MTPFISLFAGCGGGFQGAGRAGGLRELARESTRGRLHGDAESPLPGQPDAELRAEVLRGATGAAEAAERQVQP